MTRLFANRIVATSIIIATTLISLFTVFWILWIFEPLIFGGTNEKQYRNTLNINREQYNNALAKWNNLQVTDYEAIVEETDLGKLKIVVHVDTANGSKVDESVRASYSHKVVDFDVIDSEITKFEASNYESLTVGSLFDQVNNYLYCQENSCEHWFSFLPSHYVVEFDQAMGYPRSITSISEYDTHVRRIENLNILK